MLRHALRPLLDTHVVLAGLCDQGDLGLRAEQHLSQAMIEGATIVSSAHALRAYDVPVLW
jgi:hypothetical protein